MPDMLYMIAIVGQKRNAVSQEVSFVKYNGLFDSTGCRL